MASTPKSRKAKARRLQNHTRDAILYTFDDLEEDDVKTAPMGTPGEDVPLSPKARKRVPFSVECKATETLRLWEALEQADSRDHPPMLVFTRNRARVYAVVELDDLLRILKQRWQSAFDVSDL